MMKIRRLSRPSLRGHDTAIVPIPAKSAPRFPERYPLSHRLAKVRHTEITNIFASSNGDIDSTYLKS